MAPNLGATLEKKLISYSNVYRFRNINLEDFYIKTIKKPSIKVMGLTKNFLDDSENLNRKEEGIVYNFKVI